MAVASIILPFPPASLSGHNSGHWRWTPERDDMLRALHGTMSVASVAEKMGTTRGSVRSRITALGIRKRFDGISTADAAIIRESYESAGSAGVVGLNALAQRLGRCKTTVCAIAKRMGLPTSYGRKRVEKLKDNRKYGDLAAYRLVHSAVAKAAIAKHGHNRGMLGKRHSPETKERVGKASKARWDAMTKEQREDYVTNMLKAAIAKNGRIGPLVNNRATTWKAGWREIGGYRKFYRSRWEANYARYLQWLKGRGEIADWKHEPETFWFDAIKRGVRSYLPDFRVTENNGARPLHEVKGWMDARSKTTLKRMAKYHPGETIIVIREKEYKAIARTVGPLIEGWE